MHSLFSTILCVLDIPGESFSCLVTYSLIRFHFWHHAPLCL